MKPLLPFLVLCAWSCHAQNHPIPPAGVQVSDADRKELQAGLQSLRSAIDKLAGGPQAALLPDVEIYYKAVRYALDGNEFFKPEEVFRAKELLRQGQERARLLAMGQAPWTTATGLVVRGYISKIDKSVQPYGLVVPPSYAPNLPHRWRLDTWFHGRNETLSELAFLWDRQRNPGEFTPANTIVIHLYGRYNCANKLAGETDLFEALDAVKRQYPIDENRIVIRGFSMGGAAAWHFAAHYAGEWAAAAPGAGFAETKEFLKLQQDPPSWEKTLWHQYDATDYAANFFNLPLVAYSGEIDAQKQAADIMARALSEEGLRMTHIIGPNTPHRYHPDSKVEINRLIDSIAERGRDPYPRKLRFTTWTLKYNKMKWLTVDGMGKHWERARADVEITGDRTVEAHTTNVTALTFQMGPGGWPMDPAAQVTVVMDGQKLQVPGPMTDRSWEAHFSRRGTQWAIAQPASSPALKKVHGLQGPIDDAFMDSFVFVKPTGTPLAPGTSAWSASEQDLAVREWRRQFRGDAQVRLDIEVTADDIASSNLVLWGDPGSNQILKRIAASLPVRWTADAVIIGGNKFPSATHALILIYPNPLNPKRYVVLNSGPTIREYDHRNNARQIPKLPDYAVIDITVPPDERYPGKVAAAGFFDEEWKLPN